MDTQSSYDAVAGEYARRIYGELAHKPFDRRLLDWLVEKAGDGLLCDVGCGPGHAARYLHDHGARVCGVDLSPEMVRVARDLNPGIPFAQGDLCTLSGVPDGAYAGIAALYCILHVPPTHVVDALRELRRVLRPGGVLLLTFHLGSEARHLDEWWGQAVALDFYFFEREQMKGWLADAGFSVEEALERDPYPDVEVQTRRACLFARRPAEPPAHPAGT